VADLLSSNAIPLVHEWALGLIGTYRDDAERLEAKMFA
jgi:hypothetical protein